MNVVSFPFVFPLCWFFFSAVLPHRSLLACRFASAVILPAVRNAASAHHLVFVVFFAAAAAFVFFIEASQTQWQVSVNSAKFVSASSFSFQIFISSRFVFLVVVFTPHANWGVSVNLFELLPAASFTCTSVTSLVSLCCRVDVTTRSLSFIPASLSHLSTAHSRSDDFLIAFFPFVLLQPQVLCLGT